MDVSPIPPLSRRTPPAEPPAPPPVEAAVPSTPQAGAPEVDGTSTPQSAVQPTMARDERTGVDVVQFRDSRTGEIVSQLPTKSVLAMIAIGKAAEKKGTVHTSE